MLARNLCLTHQRLQMVLTNGDAPYASAIPPAWRSYAVQKMSSKQKIAITTPASCAHRAVYHCAGHA